MSRLNKYRNSRKSRRQNMRGGGKDDRITPIYNFIEKEGDDDVPMEVDGDNDVQMDVEESVPMGVNGDPPVDGPNNPYKGGGSSRKRRRNKRRKSRKNKTLKGGCSPLGSAILPFGLLGFQKYVQSYASRRKSYRKRSNKMRGRRSRKQSNQ